MLTDLLAALAKGEPIGNVDLAELSAEIAAIPEGQRGALAKMVDAPFRAAARNSIAAYIDYLDLGFRPAKHHTLAIEALEALERREIERLMILMPPGSAKSTYGSGVFPAWYLGRNPTHSAITASYAAEAIERWGRRSRNMFMSPRHRAVFGVGLAADSNAAYRWDTDQGGEYYAVGVGGAVTGRRGDLGWIDDPVKGREEADSELIRNKTWEWYISDFRTRLKPGAVQGIVMTRWHEDDLGGRVLALEGKRWHVIKLPMEAGVGDPLGRQPGERLWPEWFTAEMMNDAKRDVRAWNALYQQEPAAEEGDYFKRDWFGADTERPRTLAIYGASDYAVTEGAGDFTEHGIFGIDGLDNIHVIDWWRGQATADVWIEAQCDLINRYQPLCWFGESGPIRRSVEPFLLRRMEERRAFCRVEWLPSINDKPTRCRPFQARASMGKVFFPAASTWHADVLGQLLRFPAGMHDDAVDTCSLIGRGLETIRPPDIGEIRLQTRANVGYARTKRWAR